jgi:hypothetical protein
MTSSVSNTTAQSIEAINQVLKQSNAQTIETAKKMVKVNAEMAIGKEAGKGEMIDLMA